MLQEAQDSGSKVNPPRKFNVKGEINALTFKESNVLKEEITIATLFIGGLRTL